MPKLAPVSMDVYLTFDNSEPFNTCVNMSIQEAYNLLMMPAFAGLITSMVPVYGMPSVPEPENKE